MNDTHGETGKGWYGFDLDGTLAKYDGWKGIDHIGEPVKPMVELIKQMHDEGKIVKIVTARVAPRRLEDGTIGEQFTWLTREPSSDPTAKYTATQYIQDWCEEQLGFVPEIVYQKDPLMLELYDDRVKQVVPNEGWLIEDIAASKRIVRRIECVEYVNCKWYDRLGSFFFGMMVATVVIIATQIYLAATMPVPEAERRLHDAASDYMQSKLNEHVEALLK